MKIPFAGLFGLNDQNSTSASAAVIAERDAALEKLNTAEQGYNKLHAEYTALLEKVAALETAAGTHAATVATLTTERDAALQAKTDLETALPDKIKAEAIRLAAAQGVELNQLPPPPGGGGADPKAEHQEKLKAAIAAMQAEPDPAKRGVLALEVKKLRASAPK